MPRPVVRLLFEIHDPGHAMESAVWIGVAITAGFCEELVYRGYLQLQFWSLMKNPWSAVALKAIVFGSAHLTKAGDPQL